MHQHTAVIIIQTTISCAFLSGIKRLQVMLLKISLCLGVEVHTPVKFEKILEPDRQQGRFF